MAVEETRFLRVIGDIAPESTGYRDPAARRATDRIVRDHIAAAVDALRERIGLLKASAEEEGEEDMRDDLDRIDQRMERTCEALRSADYSGIAFMEGGDSGDDALERICAYDRALLEDLDLLSTDVMGLKYETIGNLTLREIEGTLAAIELKVSNRKDVFDTSGGS
ncbi:MAG TPA: hypothetical protein VFP98_08625 [Candidatus Polarisedimenticolia bacterium]|nr:hypothetical protein [Candidatus Polarisedimenticolia bacterium]